jgi:O-antigen/teichoic acid export membrane protein
MRFAPVKSAGLAIVATAVQRLVVVVAIVWLSRSMQPTAFGEFSFLYAGAVAYASVVLMPASQSFGAAVTRHQDVAGVANFYLVLVAALAIVAGLAFFGFVRLASGAAHALDATAVALAVALVLLLVVAGMLNSITFSAGARRAATGATLIANLVGAAALVWLSPVRSAETGLLPFLLISVLGGVLVLHPYATLTRARAWPAAAVRGIELRQVMPLIASGCLGAPAHALCLSFLLHGRDGLHDVAHFNVAFQFYGLMIFIPGVLAVALMPYFRSDRAGASGSVGLRSTLLLNFAIGLVPLLVFALGARWLTVTVFGSAYEAAAPSVVLLSFVGLAYGLTIPCLQWFIANRRSGEIFAINLAYSLVYVAGAYVLIGRGLGHVGLSIAFLAAMLVMLLLQAWRIRRLAPAPGAAAG